MALNTNDHSKAALVKNRFASIEARTAITAMATQRPGWRTGRASMRPGRSPPVGAVLVVPEGVTLTG